MERVQTDVLVVGGGTGATAAALTAARRGASVILASEGPWLGGMLTSAGVCAPDGNELAAFQTGIWGEFLRALERRQPGGLDHGWVSFFTYEPAIAAAIFADWVAAEPRLRWWPNCSCGAVLRNGDRVVGAQLVKGDGQGIEVEAAIVLDGTELGDVLALGEIPHRWGWDWEPDWHEPSAPTEPSHLTDRYPVQAPTWVVYLQDFGPGAIAPLIEPPDDYDPSQFEGAWEGYGPEDFLTYGRIAGDRFMINWPRRGNDYAVDLNRLIKSPGDRAACDRAALAHSQGFAHFIQSQLGRRYGLAPDLFPTLPGALSPGGAFALHPYYRESRRLKGIETVLETDLLPVPGGYAAPLPRDRATGHSSAIAIGNYANDHHYPGWDLPLAPKSRRWGGRWTGTPFGLPYGCLVPEAIDGLLVCEKNISVSHMANGVTRLQPTVCNLGQAAGMAAALCIERRCQPRDLPVTLLQEALLNDPVAPAAIAPCYDLTRDRPDWQRWQRYYSTYPDAYPASGNTPVPPKNLQTLRPAKRDRPLRGTLTRPDPDTYRLEIISGPNAIAGQTLNLVTLDPAIAHQLQKRPEGPLAVWGPINRAGRWLRVEHLA
ncbi:MAG: FAD-dependent oxidoreductase [Cyanophyceae cyanobacterium]